MNGYKAFWRGKTLEVRADTSRAAQVAAAKLFKAKKDWEVSVVLCELGEKQVTHSPADF